MQEFYNINFVYGIMMDNNFHEFGNVEELVLCGNKSFLLDELGGIYQDKVRVIALKQDFRNKRIIYLHSGQVYQTFEELKELVLEQYKYEDNDYNKKILLLFFKRYFMTEQEKQLLVSDNLELKNYGNIPYKTNEGDGFILDIYNHKYDYDLMSNISCQEIIKSFNEKVKLLGPLPLKLIYHHSLLGNIVIWEKNDLQNCEGNLTLMIAKDLINQIKNGVPSDNTRGLVPVSLELKMKMASFLERYCLEHEKVKQLLK